MKIPTLTAYVFPATFVRDIDGDTFVLLLDQGFHGYRQEHIRLAGVNTPEIFGRTASAEGKRAQAFTTAWLNAATAAQRGVTWPFIYWSAKYDEREKYGRSLGYLLRADTKDCLNDALIAEGWGVP